MNTRDLKYTCEDANAFLYHFIFTWPVIIAKV